MLKQVQHDDLESYRRHVDQHLIQFRNVTCLRVGRVLFEGLNLAVAPGDALLVTGPNGAGKSSLLRIAAGLLRPAAGMVAREAPPAFLGHDNALDRELPLANALAFWAKLDGVAAGAVDAALADMDLAPLATVPVRMLSAGQSRRAGLARVIASEARLWLLDEPGVGLDAAALDRLAAAMARHRANGGGIIATTHMPLGLDAPATLVLGA